MDIYSYKEAGKLEQGDEVLIKGKPCTVVDIWKYGKDEESLSIVTPDSELFGYHVEQKVLVKKT